jgi:hypothetical protein
MAKLSSVKTTTAGGGNRSRPAEGYPLVHGLPIQALYPAQCASCSPSRPCGQAGGHSQGGQKSQPGYAPRRQRRVFRAAFSDDDHPIGRQAQGSRFPAWKLLAIMVAWAVVLAWYLTWGLLLVPYRLIRRAGRKRRRMELQHCELMATIRERK